MSKFEHHHLEAERDGDTLTLRQVDHSGNEAVIALHIAQLRHLAEELGLLAAGLPADLLRRLERLRDDAIELWGFLDSVPSFPPHADEDEDVARAHRLGEDIESLLADYSPEAARAHQAGAKPATDKSGSCQAGKHRA